MHITRRAALGVLGAAVAGGGLAGRSARALGGDVPWLSDVQRVPEVVPREETGRLEPLLVGNDGEPITTLAEWKERRAEIRRRWLDFLGPMPAERPAVRLEVLKDEQIAEGMRQLVRYEGEPGLFVEGYLLRPGMESGKELIGREGRRPGVVALHPTNALTIDEIAGVSGRASRHTGVQLCGRGFVVFCPRNFLWEGVSDYNEAVAQHRKRHPRTLGMHKMLYDAQRGVDVLASLPEVDPLRLGAFGHSLGAKEALYLAAFDERIRAAVASEGGLGLRSTNWDAPWYLGEAIRDPEFALNHHQLVALIAPRALLVLAGESGPGAADGDRSWPYVEAALPVYRLYGETARVGILNHRQGHALPDEAVSRMMRWLEVYLGVE